MCVQGDFQIGRVIGTVKYANDLVLLTKDEAALLGMTDGLTGSGICYGLEMNVEKTKAMGISRQLFPLQIMLETTDECEMFQLFG